MPAEDAQKENASCPRCSSHHLMLLNASNVPLVAESVSSFRSVIGKIGLRVCGACGYTEFHTLNHTEL